MNDAGVSSTAGDEGDVVLLPDGVSSELPHAAASATAPIAITTVAVRRRVTCMDLPLRSAMWGHRAARSYTPVI